MRLYPRVDPTLSVEPTQRFVTTLRLEPTLKSQLTFRVEISHKLSVYPRVEPTLRVDLTHLNLDGDKPYVETLPYGGAYP